MKIKIKNIPYLIDTIRKIGNVISQNGINYYNLPQWFKETEDESIIEIVDNKEIVDSLVYFNEIPRKENSGWIETTYKLPREGKYVLGRYSGGNWHDSEDQDNVICVVVKRIKGEAKDNNKVPYKWDTFGPGSFFGQDISHWMPIEGITK